MLKAGHDDAFIDRAMPAFSITLPMITSGAVQVAEQQPGIPMGVVAVQTTMLPGISLLHSLYVDPPYWRRGIGRVLFQAAVARARHQKAGALVIYAAPSGVGFYKRLGAIGIGDGPFHYSPDVVFTYFLYIVGSA
jgi:GNAT superfamily N-acetyltransferase